MFGSNLQIWVLGLRVNSIEIIVEVMGLDEFCERGYEEKRGRKERSGNIPKSRPTVRAANLLHFEAQQWWVVLTGVSYV